MLLWTIQPKTIHDQLVRDGEVYCDGRRSTTLLAMDYKPHDNQFRAAYKWMSKRMRERGIPVRSYPIWAWYKYPGAKKGSRKISLPRAKWEADLHVESCRIEFDAPEELVLLSDFELWHAVLNKWVASDDFAEIDLIDAAEKDGIDVSTVLEKTWDRIFLIDKENCKSLYNGDDIAIQACVPYLKQEWIKRVDHFLVTERTTTYKRIYGTK